MAGAAKRLGRNRSSRLDISFGELGRGADGAAERQYLLIVIERIIDGISNRADLIGVADKVFHFIRNHAHSLALTLPPSIDVIDCLDDLPRPERVAVLRNLAAAFPDTSQKHVSSLDLRMNFLARSVGLSEIDRSILGILARRSVYSIWQRLVEKTGDGSPLCHVPAVALMTGESEDATYRAYSDKGSLKVRGLAEDDSGRGGIDLNLYDFVKRFINSEAETDEEMIAELMPVSPPSTLEAASFSHMSVDLTRARRLIAHGLETGDRANILLYGLPGTGKTEFARLLAADTCSAAISVGEADDEGDEPTRWERLGHLGLCRRLISHLGKAVLVIDEAEDLFLSGIEKRGSKLWLNRLVEGGRGPHIWIVNNPELLGEPVVRRMDMAVRFDTPPAAARRQIVTNMLSGRGTGLTLHDSDRRQLVTDLADLGTSPAIISAAVRTAVNVAGDAQCVVTLARGLAEASGRPAANSHLSSGPAFDPAFSVADCDLIMLADRLSSAAGNWSLLLSGPPGTGKSAYARYIAERAGRDLMCVSGSELLGAFVGETEKQIAAAFARAERSGSVLLIDEADSFLTNRDAAQHNWEVSMTNELLRQLEHGRVRFIATTNRTTKLDPASLRRFTLQAEFAPLDAGRAGQLYRVTFGHAAHPALARLQGLTPGDFAQTAQRARLLGETRSEIILRWLRDVIEKRNGNPASIGFHSQ